MGETLEYLESAFPDEPEQWGGTMADVDPNRMSHADSYDEYDEEDDGHECVIEDLGRVIDAWEAHMSPAVLDFKIEFHSAMAEAEIIARYSPKDNKSGGVETSFGFWDCGLPISRPIGRICALLLANHRSDFHEHIIKALDTVVVKWAD